MTTKTSHPAEPERPPRLDARMRVALVSVLGVGSLLAAAATALFGGRTGLSVAAGAGLAFGNLWALSRVVASLLPQEGDAAAGKPVKGPGAWGLVAPLKTVGLLVAAWMLLSYRVAAPLPMLVGFGALPIGIAIGALVSDRRPQPKEPD